MRSLRTTTVATIAASTLLLAACGSESDKAASSSAPSTTALPATASPSGAPSAAEVEVVKNLTGVTVDTKNAAKPAVKVENAPLRVDRSQMQVLTPGTGQKITPDMSVTIDYVLSNGRDGKLIQSTFESGSPEVVVMKATIPGMAGMLKDQQVGAKLVGTLTPRDSFAAKGGIPQKGVQVSDPVVVYVEIKSARVPLTKATGTAVPPKAGLPTVTWNETKPATIAMPKSDPPPTEIIAQPLIEGTGAKVASGQSITVTYTGALWTGGKVFDSSFNRGEPATFSIGTGGVIPCWDKSLVGKPIGSRYLLVCPPAEAYKDKAQGDIPKNSTLVFVVDILDATTPAAAKPAAKPTK